MASAKSRALTLTRILVQAGVVTDQQVEMAIARQRETGMRSGELLVQMGMATEEDIGWALARQLDLSFIDPRPETLDHDLIRSFPEELLRRHDALPLVLEDDAVAVAFADPTDYEAIEEITLVAGRPLRLAVAAPSAIRRVLRDEHRLRPHDRRASDRSAPGHPVPLPVHHAGAVFLLERLDEASEAGAGEIHLLPHPDRLDVWHRVGGSMVAAKPRSRNALTEVLAWIEALGGPALMPIERHSWGRISCPAGPVSIELEVSLLRQPAGVCVSIEPLTPPIEPVLERLGLEAVELAGLRDALSAPAGLGLIAGPPGSGGSTTLEAMARELESEMRRCVRWNAGPFADGGIRDSTSEGLMTALIHGADVAALDDVPAAALAETLAPTGSGRWVIARVVAADTFALLEQLASTPLERAALAERLRFVVQQRRAWRARGAPVAAESPASRRCPVFEVLVVDDGLREALRAGEPSGVLRARATAAGFVPLSRRMQSHVTAGRISESEALRWLA